MKPTKHISDVSSATKRPIVSTAFPLLVILSALLLFGSSCGLMHNLFGQKSGCPSDGKNVGAERILSGEKVPKASKFKA
jgi:hypothetical protein